MLMFLYRVWVSHHQAWILLVFGGSHRMVTNVVVTRLQGQCVYMYTQQKAAWESEIELRRRGKGSLKSFWHSLLLAIFYGPLINYAIIWPLIRMSVGEVPS